MTAFYIHIFNDATKQSVSFQRINAHTFDDALNQRDKLRREYGNIGCHTVKLLMELYADKEDE